MKNLAFVWYWSRASEIYPNWRDGLRAALEEIGKTRHVAWYFDEQVPPEGYYDFILFWGDSNCPFFDKLDRYQCKKGICLSTMPKNFDNLRKLDVVYCESTPVYEAVRSQGIHAIKAFGTDTAFFTPAPDTAPKDIEYFYPATFSPWKCQSVIASFGSRLVCVGTIQPDGQNEYEACIKNGVRVEVGYFSPEKIRDYYRRAKKVIIPAIHGSERTVLEAMAMNVPVEICNPSVNYKAQSYIDEFQKSEYVWPRDFIVNNYSHSIYAKQLLRGMI